MRSRPTPSCTSLRPGTVAGESAAGVLLGIFLARRAEDPLARLLAPSASDDDVYRPAKRALERVAQEMRANPLLEGVSAARTNRLALEALHQRALTALREQTSDPAQRSGPG